MSQGSDKPSDEPLRTGRNPPSPTTFPRLADGMGVARRDGGKQRLSASTLIFTDSALKILVYCHSVNKEILSCFLEKRSIDLQRTVFGYRQPKPPL